MNEEDKKALQKGLSAAARKLKKQAAATATRSSSELGGRIERPKSKDTRMPATGKKKKTTSEFRNGGVVDLGDFKGSF